MCAVMVIHVRPTRCLVVVKDVDVFRFTERAAGLGVALIQVFFLRTGVRSIGCGPDSFADADTGNAASAGVFCINLVAA